jgi:monofunctional glycosyltransferase
MRRGGTLQTLGCRSPGGSAEAVRRILKTLALLLALLVAIPLVLTPIYAVAPPVSTLMLARWATFRPVERDWVPLAQMGKPLPRAVIASEDAFFCRHHGVDWGQLRAVLNQDGGPSRGASTIAMQAARNLFLWQGAGYIRKPLEIPIALWLDLVLSKERLLEIYLNVVEWGPDGVFGAGAAAQRAFGKAPSALTARQAALLAAALPNPILRNPAKPGGGMLGLASRIDGRARRIEPYFDCLP